MKHNKISTTALLLGLAAIVAVSCQKSPFGQEQREEGENALTFSPVVSEYIYPESELSTKGTLINNTGASVPFQPGEKNENVFSVTAWNIPTTGDPVPFITDFQTVKYFDTELAPGVNRNMWNTIGSDGKIVEYTWRPLADKKTPETKLFYAYSNLSTGSEVTASIDGTTSKPVMVLTHTVPETASAQTDILLGGYKGNGKDSSSGFGGTATIHFQHPLTSVILTMGTVKGAKTFSINKVSLEGVYKGGKATMNDAGVISWAPNKNDKGEFETTTVYQEVTFTLNENGKLVSKEGEQIGEPFIVIPETFASDGSARICVSVKADGRDIDLYYPLVNTDKWDPGHVVTYKINYNGHEGIQLWYNGPYWATANVGAENPEDCGWFFTWGNVRGFGPTEMSEKSTSCKWVTMDKQTPSVTLIGGFIDTNYLNPGKSWKGETKDDPDCDAAFKIMGEKWRMPTMAELQALVDNTEQTHINRNGHDGYLFTGIYDEEHKIDYSNRSIFLPSGGYGNADQYVGNGTVGIYWSSSKVDATYAHCLEWGYPSEENKPAVVNDNARYYGRNIRAVENF